ncbi:MAG TPA: DnaA regulatory inactivator Hda [Woeseiaceae bacterium]|jgi:DnaA family protein|nr:DnaA regulatory inactivator Hda [Woeseiaceae bacterium]
MSQLALPLQLADHAVFESFHAHGNETLVATLRSLSSGAAAEGCWLFGPKATGKTHLLQAVCDKVGDRSVYLPCEMLGPMGPGVLEGFAHRALVCIDDIDRVSGEAEWEVALFGLCNELQDNGGQLVIAAGTAPRKCGFKLADLESRMSRLPVFQLQALDDEHRAAALQLRAGHRGLELPDDTAAYLLRRSRRDMASLYELLDRLDFEALRAKRRLTIPFVREVIGD